MMVNTTVCAVCGDRTKQQCDRCKRYICYMCLRKQGEPCSATCVVTQPATPQKSSSPKKPAVTQVRVRSISRANPATTRPRKKRAPAQQRGGSALTPQSTPYYIPTNLPVPAYQLPAKQLVDLGTMTPDALIAYVELLRAALIKKKEREQKYLDGRARRRAQFGGMKTSTDFAYEEDQTLEEQLIELLYYIEEQARQVKGQI